MGSLGWKEDLALHIWPQNRRLFWCTWHTEAERVLAGQIWEKEMVSEKKCGHKGSFSVDQTEWSIHALNHSAFSPCIIYRWKSKNAILRILSFFPGISLKARSAGMWMSHHGLQGFRLFQLHTDPLRISLHLDILWTPQPGPPVHWWGKHEESSGIKKKRFE